MITKLLLAVIAIAVVTFVTISLSDRAEQRQMLKTAQEHRAQVQKDYDAAAKASVDSFSKRWSVPKK